MWRAIFSFLFLSDVSDNAAPCLRLRVKYIFDAESALVGNVINFYVAGSSPVVTTLNWHLLNFAQNQDLQGEVQREIDSVLGAERQATWEDRLKMPFTTAVIREMYRWNSAAALGLPRGFVWHHTLTLE